MTALYVYLVLASMVGAAYVGIKWGKADLRKEALMKEEMDKLKDEMFEEGEVAEDEEGKKGVWYTLSGEKRSDRLIKKALRDYERQLERNRVCREKCTL